MDVKLTNLATLIQECWGRAECETIQVIAGEHPDPDEDEITLLFSGKLRTAVREVSDAGMVEKAFLTDLRESIPNLGFVIERSFGD